MNKAELKSKIAKMEAGLENPNIQGGAREALVKALANAKVELSKMDVAKPKVKKVAVKPVAKKKNTAKPAETKEKPNPSSSKPSVYSWKKKADLSQFSPIILNCQHYHLPVKEDTRVSLKRTGSTSVVVTAKPGDHIIFDEDGYAVFVMEAGSFKKKCTEKKAVQENQKEAPKPSRKSPSKAARAKKPTATKKKAAPKEKPTKRKRRDSKPSTYMTAINAFNKVVESIRKAYKKPETDEETLKKDIAALALKSDQENYTDYVERRINRLKDQKVRATDEELIRIGIALRPLVQTLRGTLRDAQTDNRKVLEPSLDNLIRWSKSPGQYDLAGVDAAATKSPTVTSKVTKEERNSFIDWLFN